MIQDDRFAQDRVTLLAAMEEVTAGLAHELNQPLSAISLYARGSIRRLEAGTTLTPEDLAETLENIAQQAQRAGRIIRDARSRTRIGEVSRRAVDPVAFLEDACAVWKQVATAHQVRFTCEQEGDLPPLRIDPIQIRHALGQVLRNAVEAATECAHPGERTLRVTSRAVDEDLELQVQGAPPGIAPPDLELWFEPFFTTKPGHLGLGLGVSRNLLRLHGGTLEGRRTGDDGLEWILRLPAAGLREAE